TQIVECLGNSDNTPGKTSRTSPEITRGGSCLANSIARCSSSALFVCSGQTRLLNHSISSVSPTSIGLRSIPSRDSTEGKISGIGGFGSPRTVHEIWTGELTLPYFLPVPQSYPYRSHRRFRPALAPMSTRESGPSRDSRAISSKAGSKQAQRCTSLVWTLFDDARYLMRFLFSKQKERKYGYGSPPPPLEEQRLGKKAERGCSVP